MAAADAGWMVSPVLLATNRRERLRGVRTGIPRVLLETSAVHGRGLAAPLQLAGIDADGVVCSTVELAPQQFRRLQGVAWILELPITDPVPPIGTRLAIYPRLRDRKAHLVRNANRESRGYLSPSQG